MKLNLNNIMASTDFSEASKQALPYVEAFAKKFGATITLVYVAPTPLPMEYGAMGVPLEGDLLAKQAQDSLERFRTKELPGALPVKTQVLTGAPYLEITRGADELGSDLIVLSTRGHTGLKHLLLGSTAERVVRHAPCPVLTIRDQSVRVKFPGDSPCGFKRILVPMDFSEASNKALSYASALAEECDAEITLLHVVEPPAYPEFGYAHVPMQEGERRKAALDKLELARQGPAVDPRFVKSVLVRTGDAAQEILEEAKRQNSDLIAVSTHGYTGLKHFLLGSTTERIVRHASCPVLVVREHEHEFIVSQAG